MSFPQLPRTDRLAHEAQQKIVGRAPSPSCPSVCPCSWTYIYNYFCYFLLPGLLLIPPVPQAAGRDLLPAARRPLRRPPRRLAAGRDSLPAARRPWHRAARRRGRRHAAALHAYRSSVLRRPRNACASSSGTGGPGAQRRSSCFAARGGGFQLQRFAVYVVYACGVCFRHSESDSEANITVAARRDYADHPCGAASQAVHPCGAAVSYTHLRAHET